MTVDIHFDNTCSVPVDIDLIPSVVISLRTYLLIRYFSYYSFWADNRVERICNECNTPGGISFVIKAELKESPYTVVGVLIAMSIIIIQQLDYNRLPFCPLFIASRSGISNLI
jgi:hypothetical protein